MFRLTVGIAGLMLCCVTAFGQAAKGVDKQGERVRDASRSPASNGSKQDVSTGRGMDFGSGRTPEVLLLPNPYRISARRDVLITAIQDLMRDRKLVVDEAASKLSDGIVVSQPFTFIKGAVVSQAELSRYADVQVSS